MTATVKRERPRSLREILKTASATAPEPIRPIEPIDLGDQQEFGPVSDCVRRTAAFTLTFSLPREFLINRREYHRREQPPILKPHDPSASTTSRSASSLSASGEVLDVRWPAPRVPMEMPPSTKQEPTRRPQFGLDLPIHL